MTDVSSPETAEKVLDYIAVNETASVREVAAALGIGRNTALNGINRLLHEDRLLILRKGTGAGYPTTYAVTHPEVA